jgi:DegV family protein with EDD domain
MKNIAITTDSTADLPKEYMSAHNIGVMPLIIYLGETPVEDGGGVDQKIYEFVKNTGTTPKTAARSVQDYKDFFIKYQPEGGVLIHFSISAELSASNQNAKLAADELTNVFVIDSRSLSSGIGIQVMYAVKLAESGLPADEIIQKVNGRQDNVTCSFVVKKLDYLHKGGRCSSTKKLLSKMFLIKPEIVLENGKMNAGRIHIGTFDSCVHKYVASLLQRCGNPDKEICFITHSQLTNPKLVEEVKTQIMNKYQFAEIYETVASGTITSHCGPDTLGVIYYNNK